ncbi:hypothetical protein M427DRAFT_75648 [Gonapodya prolifera JEL478]|uniref:AN1-type domain-containing protein n=1 Tax=Gonapodya prolifera (strain JEL478) TaxID=1344416 RepID=A0A138ZXR6_GONPJ|nr:hypothetical protein M427DRAFT_75648 [Gonapodya prolifera JEL478]|eukprot:KXS09302.1 hypothetical protein M427DRAFT_75648 [Gonapodya prolifera JEL478]
MELPSLGRNCAFSTCARLDFLPFTCTLCSLSFCSDHRLPPSHSCEKWAQEVDKRVDVVCAKCGRVVEGGDVELEEHLKSNCTTHVRAALDASQLVMCCIAGCTTTDQRSLMSKCDHCGLVYCLKHRHAVSHSCVGDGMRDKEREQARAEIQEKLAKVKESGSGSGSSSASASAKPTGRPKAKYNPKIELMKLKMKAQGEASVPTDRRFYLRVYLPSEVATRKPDGEAWFFDKDCLPGKLVDRLASTYKVTNTNASEQDDTKRLRLFNYATGAPLPMQTALSQCEGVESGGRVALGRGKVFESGE